MLRANKDFVRYALSVAIQKIQQVEETGHTDGPDGMNTDKTFRFLCDMTRLDLDYETQEQAEWNIYA